MENHVWRLYAILPVLAELPQLDQKLDFIYPVLSQSLKEEVEPVFPFLPDNQSGTGIGVVVMDIQAILIFQDPPHIFHQNEQLQSEYIPA